MSCGIIFSTIIVIDSSLRLDFILQVRVSLVIGKGVIIWEESNTYHKLGDLKHHVNKFTCINSNTFPKLNKMYNFTSTNYK